MRKFRLVGLGEVLWDMLPGGKKLGGAPANFAYQAQALGGEGFVVSCIGDDELGEEILEQLKGVGLDTKYIAIDSQHPTGTVSVELDKEGKPTYIIHENVAWDFMLVSDEMMKLAAQADGVCYGSLGQRSAISRETIKRFLAMTQKECVRVYDINLRQAYYSREIIDEMLKISTVLKLNDDELKIVAQLLGIKGDETTELEELRQRYGLKMIVLTKGAKGSRLYTMDADSMHKGIATKVVDTVGAGDAFTAAVALGMLAGESLDKINERANKVASFVCSQSGAMPKMPETL
jgi:fructokinase